MDVELEQMKEGIADEVNGAIEIFFDTEDEFEGAPSFVAGEGWDVGELASGFVCYVFTCVSEMVCQGRGDS